MRPAAASPVRIAEVALLLVAFALLLSALWPGSSPPLKVEDSVGYIHWPEIPLPDGRAIPIRRPPAYPLTLDLVGHGPALAYLQMALSIASFCLLGFVLGRVPGIWIAALLACSGAIAPWNDVVLTESLTCSGIAFVAALSVMLYRFATDAPLWSRSASRGETRGHSVRPPIPLALAFVALSSYVTLLRDANFLGLPIFALGFVPYGRRWLAGALGIVLVVGLANAWIASRDGRWKTPYASAVRERLGVDPDAMAAFHEAGMPVATPRNISALARWLDEGGGRRRYELWVLSRPESYVAPLPALRALDVGSAFRARYFPDRPPPGLLERLGDLAWNLCGPPFALWLLLVSIPVVELLVVGSVSLVGATSALLVPTAYALAFLGYHAAGTEEARHLLAASFVYRLALAFGVSALVAVGLQHRRGRGQSAHSA